MARRRQGRCTRNGGMRVSRGRRQINASIAAKADFEYLYDKPYPDNSRIRVAGPFTVESLSPHRTLAVDWNDELIDILQASEGKRSAPDRDEAATEFAQMILENLKAAGVQQAHKEDRITFTSPDRLAGQVHLRRRPVHGGRRRNARRHLHWPGVRHRLAPRPGRRGARGRRRGFDVLIACAFNYDAHSAEFDKLGRVPVLKARMNPDLHMGADLKTTGTGQPVRRLR